VVGGQRQDEKLSLLYVSIDKRDRVRLHASDAAPVHEHCAEHERTRELELVRVDRERVHQRELERERQRELGRDVQRLRERCERG
jgi:hypothetical protein